MLLPLRLSKKIFCRLFIVAALISGVSLKPVFAQDADLPVLELPGFEEEQPDDALLSPAPALEATEEDSADDAEILFEEEVVIEEGGNDPQVDELLRKIEEEQEPEPVIQDQMQAEDTAPAMPSPEVLSEEGSVPQPGQEELASPETQTEAEIAIPEIPAIPADDEMPPENIFFDAESLVPAGEMGTKAPRKVDPKTEPASKFVVVKKNYSQGSRQAQLVSAERAIKLGRYDAALSIYDKLYAKDRHNVNVLMGRALALQHLGQEESAIRAYEELLDHYPHYVDAEINMLGLIGNRYPAVALQRLIALSESNPDHIGILSQVAVIQANLGQYDEALKFMGIASSMEPQNANHIFNMAVVADRAGKHSEAIRYYERALEVDTIYSGGRSIPRDTVFERLAQLR